MRIRGPCVCSVLSEMYYVWPMPSIHDLAVFSTDKYCCNKWHIILARGFTLNKYPMCTMLHIHFDVFIICVTVC